MPKIHFLYESAKELPAAFAGKLMAELGQARLEDADTIVCIGGDGLLLRGLALGAGKSVYGVTPPGSNSHGFWTDHDIHSAAELLDKIATATAVPLAPLEVEVTFTNGHKTLRHAFNDVAIERASGQAALMNVTAICDGAIAVDRLRIMGDGFVFSTALGSTGTCRSYQGPAVDIRNNVMIAVGKGIFQPRGVAPVVMPADKTSFRIDFGSVAHKRPVRIDYDGLTLEKDTDGSPIESLCVRSDAARTATLLTHKNPADRAFSVMR